MISLHATANELCPFVDSLVNVWGIESISHVFLIEMKLILACAALRVLGPVVSFSDLRAVFDNIA